MIACQHERDHGEQREAVVQNRGIDLPVAEIAEELRNIEQHNEDGKRRRRLFFLPPQHGPRAERKSGQQAEQAHEHLRNRATEAEHAARDQPQRTEQRKRQILPAGPVDGFIGRFLFQTDRSECKDEDHQDAERDQRNAAAAGQLRHAKKVTGDGGKDRGVDDADHAGFLLHISNTPKRASFHIV